MIKNKIVFITIILISILFIGSISSLAATATVNTDELRMRKEANTTSEIITYLYIGNEVEIIEQADTWYKIKYQDKEGYVRSDLIDVKEETPVIASAEKPVAEENKETTKTPEEISYPINSTTKTTLNIYILPLITSNKILNIEQGKNVTINKIVNNWAYISYEGKTGWVRNTLIQADTNKEPEKPVVEETSTKGYINVSAANLRETADKASKILTTLSLNTEVTTKGQENGWYKVQYNEYNGYILNTLISNEQVITSRTQAEIRTTDISTGYVAVNIANIRKEASTSSQILTKLNQKTKLEITGEENDFYQININNTTGFIAKRLVVDSLDKIIVSKIETNITTSSVAATSNISTGNAIVDFAKQYLGYSYVWGGKSPSTGFDCGGFTSYVYSSLGYTKYTKNDGVAVNKSDLQPGDLIYFNNAVGHVGIYIGNGQFIHAANAERGVVEDTITSGYYAQYYSYAKRIVE